MKRQRTFGALGVLLGITFVMFGFYISSDREEIVLHANPAENVELPMLSLEESFPHIIEPGTTLFSILSDEEIPPAVIYQIVAAAKPVQNLASLKSGIRFQLFYEKAQPELIGIRFRFSPIELLDVKKENGVWTAKKITEHVDIKVVTFSGMVTTSLWESAQKAKMDPNLISELADIFAWEVDFAREVRVNDRWRFTVEQKLVKGHVIGWGSILAAEFENAGTPFNAVLFRVSGEDRGYFTPQGESLRKMFLKSPIRYGRITSGFSRRRFHPILQLFRAHQGVDFGAPVGTPVRTVGEGVVTFAQASGGGGKIVKIRHNSVYQTAYKHLSGYAQGIHVGARVHQGQIIAYVGNTGLSTGPHLHFEFYQNGAYINPLSKKFPSADPVPQNQMTEFKTEATTLLTSLPAWGKEDGKEREPTSDNPLGSSGSLLSY